MKTDVIAIELSTPKIVLATTIEEAREVAIKYNAPVSDPSENCYGCVRDISFDDGKDFFSLVYINIEKHDCLTELIDTIAHEATHVVQNFFEQWRETTVGRETMAYMVGNVTSKIFHLLKDEIRNEFICADQLVEAKQ